MLGIKYESAVLAGLDETRLSAIVAQVREEAGHGWETQPEILHGRNAAREEQGLEKLGETQGEPAARQTPARHSFFDRWLKS